MALCRCGEPVLRGARASSEPAARFVHHVPKGLVLPMPDQLRARRRRRTSLVVAAAACAASAALPVTPAGAAFSLGECEGSAIIGGGASFQANVHNGLWRTTAYNAYCAPFGGVGSSAINPYPTSGSLSGSGAGRRIMGERTTNGTDYDNSSGSLSRTPPNGERFGGTDEPPTQSNVNDMNRGTDATGDEAQVRLLPVAVGAMAVAVNVPDNCDVFNGAGDVVNDAGTTHDETELYSNANSANTERVRFTKAILEDIWAGDGTYDTWGKVFGENMDAAGGTETDATCRAKPFVRVVRFDDSGSTYVFKDYLEALDPTEGWLTTYVTPDTRTWPNPDRQVGGVDTLIPADANGGGSQRTKAAATDGSIAYFELSTARGGTGNPFVRQAGADDRFWVQVQNGASEFQDPALQPEGFTSTAGTAKGARCSAVADLSGVPGGADPTLNAGGWTAASMVNTTTSGQYGICSLTYLLAWDDYADAYGSSAEEEGRARTVKDYLRAMLSTAGQQGSGAGTGTGLFGQDQAPLPLEVRDIAIGGVNAIDWCKGGCGGSGNTNNNNNGGGGDTTPPPNNPKPPGNPPVTPPPPAVVVSNEFSVVSSRARANDILNALRLPGPGRASVTARGKYTEKVRRGRRTRTRTRTVSLGSAIVEVARAGDLSVRLPMSAAAKRALGKLKRTQRMAVTVTVVYTPTGGSPRTVTRTLSLRGRKK
jgi:hypothetical protein